MGEKEPLSPTLTKPIAVILNKSDMELLDDLTKGRILMSRSKILRVLIRHFLLLSKEKQKELVGNTLTDMLFEEPVKCAEEMKKTLKEERDHILGAFKDDGDFPQS